MPDLKKKKKGKKKKHGYNSNMELFNDFLCMGE